jgi:hypothetical protein
MKVNGKDDIPYNKENKKHVLNHQPDPTSNKSTIRGRFIECINMVISEMVHGSLAFAHTRRV